MESSVGIESNNGEESSPLLAQATNQSSSSTHMGYLSVESDVSISHSSNGSVESSVVADSLMKSPGTDASHDDIHHGKATDGDTEDDYDLEGNKETQSFLITNIPPLHSGAIGMLGSVAIAVNSLTGPAMLNLPRLYQTAGFIPTTVTLALLCVLSTWCALHLANAISKVPGNINFRKEIEYSDTFRYYWGKKAFIFTHITFFCCITCLNIASIVDTAQVVDQMLSRKVKGGTMALSFESRSYVGAANPTAMPNAASSPVAPDGEDSDDPKEWNTNHHQIFAFSNSWEIIRWDHSICLGDDQTHDLGNPSSANYNDEDDDSDDRNDFDYADCIPFKNDANKSSLLMTGGYILSGVIFLPMSLRDLKENTLFQIVGFIILLILSLQFVIAFIMNGIDITNVSLWGDDWSNLFGVCLFNFAVVVAIPAWLYEKKPSVNVSTALNGSSSMAFVLYVLVGSLGAMTMQNVADNMLQSMMSGAFGEVTEVSSMAFAFFIIGLGIPLFSVLTRLNLTGSGLCSEFEANLLAVYLPWGISWMFYSGGSTTSLLGWGGIFFTSIIAFLAPLVVALQSVSAFTCNGAVSVYGNLILTKRQQIFSLYGLLILSMVAIVLAVIGEIYT